MEMSGVLRVLPVTLATPFWKLGREKTDEWPPPVEPHE